MRWMAYGVILSGGLEKNLSPMRLTAQWPSWGHALAVEGPQDVALTTSTVHTP